MRRSAGVSRCRTNEKARAMRAFPVIPKKTRNLGLTNFLDSTQEKYEHDQSIEVGILTKPGFVYLEIGI